MPRFAELPQSIFGKFTYFKEQAKILSIVKDVASGTLALVPDEILGVSLPIPKKLRYEKAKMFLKRAREKMDELGV